LKFLSVPSVEATYRRGARFEDDMSLAAKTLREGGAHVVLCSGAYRGCAAFIRPARDLGWNVPIFDLSFVGSEALLGLLTEHGRKTGRDCTRAIINSQVVPSYDDLTPESRRTGTHSRSNWRTDALFCRLQPPIEWKRGQMAKPNYAFAKRQRDIAKKQKREEKRLRKTGTTANQPQGVELPATGGNKTVP
jgi:hypothetical protein